MYKKLLFILYMNVSPSSFLFSSRGSFASMCRCSAGEVLKAHLYSYVKLVSYLGFYPGSKSFPTIRSCSFSFFHIFSYMLISFRNLMTFATLHSIPSIFFMSLSMPCFLLSSFHWGQSCRQCFTLSLWFPHFTFLHFGGCLFLDIKYP